MKSTTKTKGKERKDNMIAARKIPDQRLWPIIPEYKFFPINISGCMALDVDAFLNDQVTAALKLATAFGGSYEYKEKIYGGGIKITKIYDPSKKGRLEESTLRIELGPAICKVAFEKEGKPEFYLLEMNEEWRKINLVALPLRWIEESEKNGKEDLSSRQFLIRGNEARVGTAKTNEALNKLKRR
jgi:hypothetical protein